MFHVDIQGFVMVMEVLGLVFGVLGAFVVFFVFMAKKNEERYTGRLAKLYDFLNFRFYIIEDVLRFCYILAACLCTAVGVFMALTVVELTRGLVLLVGGNLAARMAFEFLMMLVKACRNLGEVGREEKVPVYIEKRRERRPEIEAIYERESISGTEEAAAADQTVSERQAEEEEKKVPQKKETVMKKIMIRKEAAAEEKPEKERQAGYKVCPSCGEKCSVSFAFCNMCGSRL